MEEKSMRSFGFFKKLKRWAHSDDPNFEAEMKSLLVGRKIVEVNRIGGQEAALVLDDGTELVAVGNEGCGGCGNGWYYLDELNGCDNAVTNVECCIESGKYSDDVYHLFVFADNEKINCLQFSGSDNGYYGTGYDLYVRKPNAMEEKHETD
jgi:hypothetical protein